MNPPKYSLTRIAMMIPFLLLCSPLALAFQDYPTLFRATRYTSQYTLLDRYVPLPKLTYLQSQGVEEDYRMMNHNDNETTMNSRLRWLSWRRWKQAVRVDRKQVAELGISFMLTYNLVSNINGSIFLSLAWYISSIRTGLSPLAAGQWKALLGTYAGLYVFITLFRPLRLALAVGLTGKVAHVLDQTQERFNCSKAVSVGMVLSAMLSFWLIFASCSITLASILAGVPIWQGL